MLQRLPSRLDPLIRLNGLCPYYTMFPLEFPFQALRHSKLGDTVLDPFCGRGTTNFAARLRGLRSFGVDANPVAVAIGAAKVVSTTPHEVSALCAAALKRCGRVAVPEGDFWQRCYERRTLIELCRLRHRLLERCVTPAEVTLRALILGILHGPLQKGKPTYLSNQMPRTYATKPMPAVRFWKAHRLSPKHVGVLDAVTRRARYSLSKVPESCGGAIRGGDSRKTDLCEMGRVKWIVTSPPYFGMRSYVADQWLRLWFLGGPDDVVYTRENQVSHGSEEVFVAGLSEVWKNVAKASESGARMVVRFGALPSVARDPSELLRRSLRHAGCGWKVTCVRGAGRASHGKRQCEQFVATAGADLDEIDLYARLEP